MENFSRPLVDWYKKEARPLPWREEPTPYRVWVSEIMLQQTRIEAAREYFNRFTRAFPTVEALAAAELDDVLKLWEGLGYYSRARNLHKCAKTVCETYGGVFPPDAAALRALPGIGDYTAGAIASIAYGLPEPAVDGNVLRVVTRLTDCHDDIADQRTKRAIRAALVGAMPSEAADIRIFNQAMMELGATLCGPNTAPQCGDCPVRALCLGHQCGTAEALPVKKAKKERRIEEKTVFLLLGTEGVALRKRPKTGLLAGLWEFPNVPGTLDESAAAAAVAGMGLTPVDWKSRLTSKHIFTHVEWHMTGYILTVRGSGAAELVWADGPGLLARSVPSAFARYYAEALRELEE